MDLRSLAYRTDLIFPRFDGEVVDRGGYIVVRTPANPSFYWGNFLLFERPPGPGDLERWTERFVAEIGAPPEVGHMAFGWDSPGGELGLSQPFLDAGFRMQDGVVLVSDATRPPPRPNAALTMRPMVSDADWDQALSLMLLASWDGDASPGIVEFSRRAMARYRAMAEAGLGAWVGAFDGGRMVGGLGIFAEAGIARFQAVGTHPAARGVGVCGTLVHWASRYAAERLSAGRLVIVADVDSQAARIYESVGFRPAERQVGLERAPG
jgi:GNAT superfamily N-acetyltransferase